MKVLAFLLFVCITNAAISDRNPWLNINYFINPEFAQSVSKAVAIYPAQQTLLELAARYPVAYWVDTIAKVPNVTNILSQAKAIKTSTGQNMLVEFIIYDLPNRDCAALASNGEIPCEDLACANGINRYKTEYIDPIVAQMRNFPEITIVALIEPDSLPNLSTNQNKLRCPTASTAYVQGTAYAIKQLGTLPNVAIYLDAAHGGWMGWPNNANALASTFKQVLDLAGGAQLIRGFATNTANYQALGSMSSTSDPCKLASQFNQAIDEVHYVDVLDKALSAVGITGKGYLIDTSRNGVPNTRADCANWCNIKGAGIGARPTANTAYLGTTKIDALHWAKVPGESDGVADPTAPRYDSMCSSADSVSGAPQAGQWFASYFLDLCQNAQPSLSSTPGPSPVPTPTPVPGPGPAPGPTPVPGPAPVPGVPANLPTGTLDAAAVEDLKQKAEQGHALAVGASVGIAIGVIAFVAIVAVVIAVLFIRRRRGDPWLPEFSSRRTPAPSLSRGVSTYPSSANLVERNIEAPTPRPQPPATPKPQPPAKRALPPPPRRPLPPGWEAKKTPDGKEFWRNKETGESSWEMPQ
jgi:cellulose 1,4-beta-cellobiosidase